MRKKKKASKGLIIIMFFVILFVSYLVGAAFARAGVHNINDLGKLSESLNYVSGHLFEFYFTKQNAKTIVIAMSAGFMGWMCWGVYYVSSIKNYMQGKEYGDDEWGDAQALTKKLKDNEGRDKIISEHVRISINDKQTRLNTNLTCVGGSGAGKSAFLVTPNIFQLATSMVITDAKGDLIQSNGNYLRQHGYDVKCINFKNFKESDHFNPFVFVHNDEDIRKLITNLIANTTPKGTTSSDPFWEKAESAYLQALMAYSYYEGKASFPDLLDLIAKTDVDEDGEESEMDKMIKELEDTKGSSHPAVRLYKEAFKGAADTIRSVIMSANSRLAFMNTPAIREILSSNDIDFADVGMGKGKDGVTKTALFFVIPANDKTYNSIIGMAYTQLFNELYKAAEEGTSDTRLPIPVQIWMDEFANIALPESFENVLSTCRSYGIGINIILQNISQLKALFKDSWESIIGNCDTFLYLGGNEQSTHKYVSELLGKWTIDKQTTSKSYGKGKSSSQSEDRVGVELMTATQVRKMPRQDCIVFVSGQDPIYDKKYRTFNSKEFKEAKQLGKYVHHPAELPVSQDNQDKSETNKVVLEKEKNKVREPEQKELGTVEQITMGAFEYYKNLAEKDENIKVYNLTATDLDSIEIPEETEEEDEEISLDDIKQLMQEKKEEIDDLAQEGLEQEKEMDNFEGKIDYNDDLFTIITKVNLPEEVLKEVQLGLEHGLTEEEVKKYLRTDYSAEQMSIVRTLIEKEKEKQAG